MTDYTPTTEQVRNAYVRGMRDTFIASAGEHYEEFNRWMQAHDDEVRASVQPPTREQIAVIIAKSQDADYWVDEVREWEALEQWERDAYPGKYPGMAHEDRDSFLRDADAVLALFPQPGPNEVEVEGSFFAVADLPDSLARHVRALDDAHRREKQHWIDQHEQPLTPDQRRARMCPCTLEPVPPAEPVSIADMAPGTAVKDVRGVIWYRGTGSWVAANGPGWPLEPVAPVVVLDVTPPAGDAEGGALTNTPRQTREQIIGDLAELGRQMFAPPPLADSLTIVAIRASYAEFQSTGDLHELARAVGNILKATAGTDE